MEDKKSKIALPESLKGKFEISDKAPARFFANGREYTTATLTEAQAEYLSQKIKISWLTKKEVKAPAEPKK
jgi:hypothetical protein